MNKILILGVLCMTLLTGCSIPRIMIVGDPLSATEHVQLGQAYEQQGEFEAALREYDKASKDFPRVHLYKGNVYFQQGAHRLAEKAYLRAINELPDEPRSYNNLAWLYYMYYTEYRKLKEAETLAQKALALADPESEKACKDTLKSIQVRLSQGSKQGKSSEATWTP